MLAARLVATLRLRQPLLIFAALALAACGGGGAGGGANINPPPLPGGSVTISGRVTFERVPFKSTLGSGLDFSNPVNAPARGIVVEALSGANGPVLASTTTNASGDYSLTVGANRSVQIRAKAQMLSGTAPTMNFRVLNNTNGSALYVLDGSASSSGSADSTRDLHASAGWGGTTYIATRSAAPFAILDTVYQAKNLISNAAPSTNFPALNLYWSTENKTTSGTFCTTTGDIGTSFYTPDDTGNCGASAAALPGGIYILGFLGGGNGDTDEFDQHVIAHEFGHYVEHRFGRSDSIGGEHSNGDLLDLRVAFGEGWGNAYSGMTLNDPQYRDSSGSTFDGGLNMENDSSLNEGWFSEASVGEIIWDAFDTTADANDTVALDFGPIYSVMTGAQADTDAFTSIFSFATALRAANPTAASGITQLLTGENISGTDEFGAGESNNGGNSRSLPIYVDVALNVPLPGPLCTGSAFDVPNRLDNRRFLRLTLTASALVSVSAQGAAVAGASGGAAATDPDIIVYRRGVDQNMQGEDLGASETTIQKSLAAGTYIIEIYDYDLLVGNNATGCMTVTVTGT